MIKRTKEFVIAAMTLTVLGVGCLAESKHSMGLAMKTESLLVVESPSELKIAQRQEQCQRGSSVTPSKETKKIVDSKFSISFNIPTNYQTEKRQDDKTLMILLHNPADTKLLECGKRNRLRGYGHGTVPVQVSVQPATPETRLIPELNAITLRLENIRETTIAKQKAFVYIAKSSMTGKIDDADTSLVASFFTPDKRNKITISIINAPGTNISGSLEEKVFNTVISSFAFVR
jgi:hypothetical protein